MTARVSLVPNPGGALLILHGARGVSVARVVEGPDGKPALVEVPPLPATKPPPVGWERVAETVRLRREMAAEVATDLTVSP